MRGTQPSIALVAEHPARMKMPVRCRREAALHRVQARLQVMQGTQRTDAIGPVSVRARVLDAQGRAVRDHSLILPENAFTNRRAACQIAVDVAILPDYTGLLG